MRPDGARASSARHFSSSHGSWSAANGSGRPAPVPALPSPQPPAPSPSPSSPPPASSSSSPSRTKCESLEIREPLTLIGCLGRKPLDYRARQKREVDAMILESPPRTVDWCALVFAVSVACKESPRGGHAESAPSASVAVTAALAAPPVVEPPPSGVEKNVAIERLGRPRKLGDDRRGRDERREPARPQRSDAIYTRGGAMDL